jgi:hypothetical protein
MYAAQISPDELMSFFVSRFKEDALIARKRHTMIVFPRKDSGRYAVRICIARRLREDDVTEVLA